LRTYCADNPAVGYFAANVNLIAVDEECIVGTFGNASTNTIGKLAKFIGE
jgi:hypothetical protein